MAFNTYQQNNSSQKRLQKDCTEISWLDINKADKEKGVKIFRFAKKINFQINIWQENYVKWASKNFFSIYKAPRSFAISI